MKRVVQLSGGAGTFGAAERVKAQYGVSDVVLLWADTLVEDWDTYRFIEQVVQHIGAPVVYLCDGRTPWRVYRERRFIGNSKVDPCSKELKRELMDEWRDANCDPADTIIYTGVDWTERRDS